MKIGSRGLRSRRPSLSTAGLTAQDAKTDAKAADAEKAMMEAWQKASTPGEAHKKLEPFVGTFDARVQMWSDPSRPPEDSTGTMTSTWVLGNRYVQQNLRGHLHGRAVQRRRLRRLRQRLEEDPVRLDGLGFDGMMWMTRLRRRVRQDRVDEGNR